MPDKSLEEIFGKKDKSLEEIFGSKKKSLDDIFSKETSPEIGFFDALGKTLEPTSDNTAIQALELLGNTISIPTRLVAAGVQSGSTDETFNESLANKTEAGKIIFGENESLQSIVADIVLDPLNFVSGAGLVKGAGKLKKIFSAGEGVSDAIKVVDKVKDAKKANKADIIVDHEKVGRGKLTTEDPLRGIIAKDQDKVLAFRGEKVNIAEKVKHIESASDETIEALYDEAISRKGFVDDDVFVFAENIKRNTADILKKSDAGEVHDAITNYLAATKHAGAILRVTRDMNYKIIDDVSALGKSDLIEALIKGGMKPGDVEASNLEKFVEWATMIKLTGASTHVKNILGNFSMLAIRPFEKAGAAAWEVLRGVAGKERQVFGTEALAELYGMKVGLREGLKKFKNVITDEKLAMKEATKFGEALRLGGAIESGGKLFERLGLHAGKIVRSPGRFLGAMDIFFKELNHSAEIAAQATRLGVKQGKKGKELNKFIANTVADPSKLGKEAVERAKFSAVERTFQEKLGKTGKSIGEFRMNHPLSRLILPFWKTPVNILKQSTQRTPLGLLLPSARKTFKTGTQAEKSELIGRAISGSAFITGATFAAMNGDITGSGGSRSQRQMLFSTGWQPYSLKFGDKYVSFRGFEPISSWLRASADIADGTKKDRDIGNFAKQFSISYSKQFLENPFFMGLHDITDSQRQISREEIPKILPNIITGSTIPVVLQQFSRVIDPVRRKPKGAVQQIKSRIPIASKDIAPLRSVYGEIVERQYPLLQALGITASKEKNNKVASEVLRLGINIGSPSRRIGENLLNDEDYDRLVMLTGKSIQDGIDKFMQSPSYTQLDDDTRKRVIKKYISKIRRMVKITDFQKYYRR